MKNTINQMLNHPFATIMIVGSVGNAVANVVRAVKGCDAEPMVKIVNNTVTKD